MEQIKKKMGRPAKAADDKIKSIPAYITQREHEAIVKAFGSLTAAVKALCAQIPGAYVDKAVDPDAYLTK